MILAIDPGLDESTCIVIDNLNGFKLIQFDILPNELVLHPDSNNSLQTLKFLLCSIKKGIIGGMAENFV